jgi:hypothetical protein
LLQIVRKILLQSVRKIGISAEKSAPRTLPFKHAYLLINVTYVGKQSTFIRLIKVKDTKKFSAVVRAQTSRRPAPIPHSKPRR